MEGFKNIQVYGGIFINLTNGVCQLSLSIYKKKSATGGGTILFSLLASALLWPTKCPTSCQDLHSERFGLAYRPGLPVVTGASALFYNFPLRLQGQHSGSLTTSPVPLITRSAPYSNVAFIESCWFTPAVNTLQFFCLKQVTNGLKNWLLFANDLLTVQLLLNILKHFRGYSVFSLRPKTRSFTFQTFASPS